VKSGTGGKIGVTLDVSVVGELGRSEGDAGENGGGVIERGVAWLDAAGDASGEQERSEPRGKMST
jgi:hypothetical protein